MANTPLYFARIPNELLEAARNTSGMQSASVAMLIRSALARMAGVETPPVKMGRPRKETTP